MRVRCCSSEKPFSVVLLDEVKAHPNVLTAAARTQVLDEGILRDEKNPESLV